MEGLSDWKDRKETGKKMSSERAASAFVPRETTCTDDVRRRSFEVDRQDFGRVRSALIRTLGRRPALVARCALNMRRILRLHGGIASGARRARSDGLTRLGGRPVLVAGLSGNAGSRILCARRGRNVRLAGLRPGCCRQRESGEDNGTCELHLGVLRLMPHLLERR